VLPFLLLQLASAGGQTSADAWAWMHAHANELAQKHAGAAQLLAPAGPLPTSCLLILWFKTLANQLPAGVFAPFATGSRPLEPPPLPGMPAAALLQALPCWRSCLGQMPTACLWVAAASKKPWPSSQARTHDSTAAMPPTPVTSPYIKDRWVHDLGCCTCGTGSGC
jgi:hypothetical protein